MLNRTALWNEYQEHPEAVEPQQNTSWLARLWRKMFKPE